jgi:hypothetical protein
MGSPQTLRFLGLSAYWLSGVDVRIFADFGFTEGAGEKTHRSGVGEAAYMHVEWDSRYSFLPITRGLAAEVDGSLRGRRRRSLISFAF